MSGRVPSTLALCMCMRVLCEEDLPLLLMCKYLGLCNVHLYYAQDSGVAKTNTLGKPATVTSTYAKSGLGDRRSKRS